MSELMAARPDLAWKRGMGALYSAVLADGRRVQVWTEGDRYAVAVGRAPSMRGDDLVALLEQATAPRPEPEPLVQRAGGVVVGNPQDGGGR